MPEAKRNTFALFADFGQRVMTWNHLLTNQKTAKPATGRQSKGCGLSMTRIDAFYYPLQVHQSRLQIKIVMVRQMPQVQEQIHREFLIGGIIPHRQFCQTDRLDVHGGIENRTPERCLPAAFLHPGYAFVG